MTAERRIRSRCFVDGKVASEAFLTLENASIVGQNEAKLCFAARREGLPWQIIVDCPDDGEILAAWDSLAGALELSAEVNARLRLSGIFYEPGVN